MREWGARRFWTMAAPRQAGSGFEVTLDGRILRTPLKSPLVLPTRAMAEAIATEWNAQDKDIAPRTMPVTRAANSAVDKVASQHGAIADMLAGYAETDLLCHRAAEPAVLVARQAAGWNPVLDWASARYGAALKVTRGVIPVDQPAEALLVLRAVVHGFQPFPLTALHDLITLSGSLILGLAVAEVQLSPECAWTLARIDEDWQAEQWGKDMEAAEMAVERQRAFLSAARFLKMSTRI
ncbi:MAG: ATPase [Rhodobacteraceae bacterium]|nr:ATPase [Paracoccaceae bacterium]